MRRFTRTLVATALTAAVMAGTAGWASGTTQQAVTGAPVGTAAWRAEGLPDPERMTPAQTAAYFAGLGSRERQRLLREHPGVVGNLDGVPPALRYAANSRASGGRFAGRQVLAYDPRGRGQAVLVYGDLTAAEHVAVIVPGSDTDAGNLDSLTRKATALREATGGRTAVVAWAGYTTPVGVGLDAATGDLAEAGAERLVRFTQGLEAVGAAAPSVFCHSYGSVVCGLAAHALEAEDLVAVASPGMRADDVAALNTSARVWAAKDPTDWIDRVPNVEFAGLGHGTDPTSPGFGARPVPAADARGHDGYFAPGTESLRAFAAIAEGEVR
ncbi:alpha/beta hydrolase [Streptomyces roseicoloratus]|uniref:Alpha/beta hydrolase n=1 Tax=Streptomyces roseicoloratus TaxID=2508722 RepID=A0ABY9S1B9_9ACTN|nr:alpha/beta hydrolase [Streptomyces roseicoloratus]WMX47249.1 alpha/beta hydrolase [Streptomyces roseicoloratus]